jgi:hypothetical protein
MEAQGSRVDDPESLKASKKGSQRAVVRTPSRSVCVAARLSKTRRFTESRVREIRDVAVSSRAVGLRQRCRLRARFTTGLEGTGWFTSGPHSSASMGAVLVHSERTWHVGVATSRPPYVEEYAGLAFGSTAAR